MHFRDGELVAWRQWFEAYPGQGGEGFGGTSGEGAVAPFYGDDCRDFADEADRLLRITSS